MFGVGRAISRFQRQLHTSFHDSPSETLRRKIAEMEKIRRGKHPMKNRLFVEVPESKEFLDTPTMPMILTAVGVVILAKLFMMYDDSTHQEWLERKIRNAPDGQGTIRMLTREEWEGIQELRPRTPFESRLARPNARIRTGEKVRMEDLKDWAVDVFTDAITRAEETVKSSSR